MKHLLHRVRSLSGSLFLATAAAVTLHTQLAADTFGSGANQFETNFVSSGNPGNSADYSDYGAVPYSYRMGTYEVSRDMITRRITLEASGSPWRT